MSPKIPVRVILVTDGDSVARKTVEMAAHNLGLRCISASAGNPTRLTGEQLVNLVLQAAYDPVLVMFDDKGNPGQGPGERALAFVVNHPDIRVLGAIAVASDERRARGVPVDCSVTNEGHVIGGPVNKAGFPDQQGVLVGDTVDILRRLEVPVIVGAGDIGKQAGADCPAHGAYLTTRAILEVLTRSQGHLPPHQTEIRPHAPG